MKHRTNFLRTIGALLLLALTLTLLCACTESRNVTGASLNDKGELILSYSDGTSDNLGIVKGRDGKDGAQGIPGLDGKTGKDGVDGEKGDPGADGKDGADGSEGVVTVVPDSNSVTLAAAKGLRSAVSIYCTFAGGTSAGSGVIWKLDSAGNALIITNHHVVYDADTSTNGGICEDIELYLYGSEYSQFAIDATYLGGSMYYDIAVLSVTESDFLKSSNAVAATVTDSDAIRVGDQAIAVGNPKGIGLSASFGVVSVESEEIAMRVGGEQEEVDMRVMRVDTAVNAGNSGGGLYNAAGELCGIVNAKFVSEDVENMGYAIPSNLAVAVAQNIVDHCDGESSRCVKRAMIGIEIRLLDSRTETKPDGRLQIVQTVGVSKINDTSAAKDILAVGDQILSITFGGKAVNVTRMHHLTDRMLDARVGDTVTLTIVRDGAEMQKQIAITETELVEY